MLSEIDIDDWLKSYRQQTADAMNAEGPLNPRAMGTKTVVRGVYDGWHYAAFAMQRVLETVLEQRDQIKQLKERIRLLERVSMEEDDEPGG